MRADGLVERLPVVGIDADAREALNLLAGSRLPGLVIADAAGRPLWIVPASQLLRFLLPCYVQDAPSLARVLPESMCDRMADRLRGKTVRALIPDNAARPAVVRHDDTIVEVAAVMSRLHCPLAAVMRDDAMIGVITASRLLQAALASPPDQPEP